jgi:HEAT repeat protein
MKAHYFLVGIVSIAAFLKLATPCHAQLDASDSAIDGHLERLESGTPAEQRKAANSLYLLIRIRPNDIEKLIEPRIVPALEKQYRENTRGEVRQMVVQALAEVKSANVLPVLILCLKDNDPQIRLHAIGALARFDTKAKDAVPVLTEGIKNGSLGAQAFYTLMKVQGPQANDTIVPLLQNRKFERDEIQDAVFALTIHPDPRAASFVEDALFSGSASVQAAVFFKKLGNRSPKTTEIMRSCLYFPPSSKDPKFPWLDAHLVGGGGEVRSVAISYLATIQDAESRDKIRRMISTEESVKTRTEAIRAMGEYRDTKSIPILFDQLKENDSGSESFGHGGGELHQAVVTALARIGTNEALQAIYDGMFIEIAGKKTNEALGEVSRKEEICDEFWRTSKDPAVLSFFVAAYRQKPLPGPTAAKILSSLLEGAGSSLLLKGDQAETARKEFLENVSDKDHFELHKLRPFDREQIDAAYRFYPNDFALVSFSFQSVNTGPRRGGMGYNVVYKKDKNRWIPVGRTESWIAD